MSNYKVEYTGEYIPTAGDASSPLQAATQIMQGYIPNNIVESSTLPEFRDATLGYILRDTTDHHTVLEILSKALRGTEDVTKLLCYSEYLTTIAFSWEHKRLAVDVMMRNRPEMTTPHIWSVAVALKKQMPGPFYQTLVIGQMNDAESKWRSMTGM
jgi:hypothetical protein